MRGKVWNIIINDLKSRITPAYAGKRKFRPARRLYWWDHPRLCGEKIMITRNSLMDMGSPPPMRGKATRHIRAIDTVGITPAYAGKRCASW